MFDLAWSEILLIAVVAVIFIGPKELPAALRAFGKWTAKARVMAGEFQRNVDDMVREAELEDVKKQFDEVRGIATNPTGAIEKWVDPKGEIRGALQSPDLDGAYDKPGVEKPAFDKPAAIEPPPATPAPPAEAAAVAAPAPAPVAPSAEPMPPAPQPTPAQFGAPSGPPPVVAPPPAGAGTLAEPKAAVSAP